MLKSYLTHRAARLRYIAATETAEYMLPYYILYCNLNNNGVLMNPDEYLKLVIESNDMVDPDADERHLVILAHKFKLLVRDVAREEFLRLCVPVNQEAV